MKLTKIKKRDGRRLGLYIYESNDTLIDPATGSYYIIKSNMYSTTKDGTITFISHTDHWIMIVDICKFKSWNNQSEGLLTPLNAELRTNICLYFLNGF